MKWAIRISNAHFPITKQEVENLLPNSMQWINHLLGIYEGSKDDVDHLLSYSASIKLILANVHLTTIKSNLFERLETVPFEEIPPYTEITNFAARYSQILFHDNEISKRRVERYIGGKIVTHFGLTVNLKQPEGTFSVIHSDNQLFLGWKYAQPDYTEISKRSPKESPFFGGGAMKPMLSKLLVNLLHPFGTVILDPFVGHGGILREIASIRSYAIGIEINPKIAREAKVNNYYLNFNLAEIIIGDAINQPFRKSAIAQCVTDPPYAKQSTTIGRDREKLIEKWLKLSHQSKIVMTLPEDMIINIPSKWSVSYIHKDYVHKSLTRVVRELVVSK